MLAFSRRVALSLPLLAISAAWAAEDPTTISVVLTTTHGKVVIRLRPDWASSEARHADRDAGERGSSTTALFSTASFPGYPWPRQAIPTGTGTGGSTLPNLPAEFNNTHFTRGTLGMARSQDPDSANSRFFICFGDAPFLDGKYTAFGEVVSGMDVVDKIKAGTEANNGMVANRQDRDHANGLRAEMMGAHDMTGTGDTLTSTRPEARW